MEDIEAYLEAQVDSKTLQNNSASSSSSAIIPQDDHIADKDDSDRRSRDKDGSDRRDKDRKRSHSRDRRDRRDRDDRRERDSRDDRRERDRDDRRSRDSRDERRDRDDRRDRDSRDDRRDRDDRRSRDSRDDRRDRDDYDSRRSRRSGSREKSSRNEPKETPEVLAQRRKDEEALNAKLKEADDLTKDQRTMFVGQLTAKVNEAMVKEFFAQLGDVKSVTMVRDRFSGKHKGFAYVEMSELEAIPNCLLFHNVVPDFQKFPILVKASEAEKNYLAKKDASITKTVWSVEEGGRPGDANYDGNWKLDSENNSYMQLNSQSRVALMAKLAGGSGVTAAPAVVPAIPAIPNAPSGHPSVCIVIQNMFDLAQEIASNEPEWNLDLQEDVVEECNKFNANGNGDAVQHCKVDTVKPGGFVYVKFHNQEIAVRAATSLHGRWFAGRLISASYVPVNQYNLSIA